jgi:uncharacterized coiled-coil protein SlyX
VNIFNDDRIPTPEECLKEWDFQTRLKALEKECAQRESTVAALQHTEQTLRNNIVKLSGTLSQLYQLSGSLAQISIPQDQEQN